MTTVTGIAPGASGMAEPTSDNDGAHDRTRSGNLRVAAIFSDHMVLQRGKPIAVFGEAPAGESVIASLSDGQGQEVARAQESADNDGTFMLTLPAMPASGPLTLQVRCGGDELAFHDVMVGEVWLAGGQSNIEFELHNSEFGKEAVADAHDPLLRFYNTPKSARINLTAESASGWQTAEAPQVAHMSAIGYYFGKQLRDALANGIAVGVVDCYIGGTSISAWMSEHLLEQTELGRSYLQAYRDAIAGKTDEEMLAAQTAWQQVFDKWNADVAAVKEEHPDYSQPQIDAMLGPCPWPPPVTPFAERRPYALYEAMIRRVAPYTLAGVLWYQGEEDELNADGYGELLRGLIAEWRATWHDDALPFLVVQLPQWIAAADAEHDPLRWPALRDEQFTVARETPHADIVCAMDCGEFDNIHPVDKRTLGMRLGDTALHDVYGLRILSASPELVDLQVSEGGGEMVATFNHAQGLHWHGTTPDTMRAIADIAESTERKAGESGFEIAASADSEFVPAHARIEPSDDLGSDMRVVHLFSPEVPKPTHARYAWRSWGPAPLFNGDGLPAFPFTR